MANLSVQKDLNSTNMEKIGLILNEGFVNYNRNNYFYSHIDLLKEDMVKH